MLGDTATKDRFQVRQIGDVDYLIDTVHERAHRVVRREPVTDQNHKMLAPLRVGAAGQLGQDRIGLQGRAFEILVNHHDVVIVGLELEHHILFIQTEVHFVGHVDDLRHDHFLILLMIDANEGGVVAQIEKRCFVLLFLIAKHINGTRFPECRGASRNRDRCRRRALFGSNRSRA